MTCKYKYNSNEFWCTRYREAVRKRVEGLQRRQRCEGGISANTRTPISQYGFYQMGKIILFPLFAIIWSSSYIVSLLWRFLDKNERRTAAVDHIRLEKNCYGGKNDWSELYQARMPNEEFHAHNFWTHKRFEAVGWAIICYTKLLGKKKKTVSPNGR